MDFVNKRKGKKKRDSSLKVVYISSPMKVKTSASKFRTIVQKLTGQDSDISSYMDGTYNINGGNSTTDFEILPETYGRVSSTKSSNLDEQHRRLSSSSSSSKSPSSSLMDLPRESPTSSDSLFEQSFPFGDVFMNSQIEEQYLEGVFPSNLLSEYSSQFDNIDVLGSYDAM